VDYHQYSAQGQSLYAEAFKLLKLRPNMVVSAWDVAFQGAAMCASSAADFYEMMRNFHPKQTRRVWWKSDTQVRVRRFMDAIDSRRHFDIDPRRKWHMSRDVISELFGLTREEALAEQLQYTVPRGWALQVQTAQKPPRSPEALLDQTRAGTAENYARAQDRAYRACDLRGRGYSVEKIAKTMSRSVRTIYRYLSKEINFVLVTCRSLASSNLTSSGLDERGSGRAGHFHGSGKVVSGDIEAENDIIAAETPSVKKKKHPSRSKRCLFYGFSYD